MADAFGDPGLAKRPDYANAKLRSKNRVALNEAIAAHTRRYTAAVLIDLLAKAGVPCGPIYKLDQVFEDPQVRHLGMAVPVPNPGGGEMTLVGPAIKLSRTPARMKRTVGEAGEHNDEILRDLGYSDADIAALRGANVI
jgi:formyl-CoA transferase